MTNRFKQSGPRLALWTFSIFSAATAFLFVATSGEDINWDRRNYHFYSGFALLTGRLFVDVAVAEMQTYFNAYVNAFTFIVTRYLPYPFGAWAITLVQLTALPLVLAIALRLAATDETGWRPTIISILAAAISLTGAAWISELGTSFFSGTTAPLVLLGILLLMKSFGTAQPKNKRFVIAAGAAFGFAAALKLTNAPFALTALAAATLTAMAADRGRGALSTSQVAVWFCGGCALGYAPAIPWHMWLMYDFGSPLFPLYNAVFRSEYYDLVSFRDSRWKFAGVGDALRVIVAMATGTDRTGEIPFADGRLALLFAGWLMLTGALLALRSRALVGRPRGFFVREIGGAEAFLVTAFTSLSVIAWIVVFAYQRYLIPVELLYGPAVLVVVLNLAGRNVAVPLLTAMLAVSIATLKIPNWGKLPASDFVPLSQRVAFGTQMPPRLATTPGRYVIYGVPNSFLVPFLHRQSVAVRVDLSAGFRSEKFESLARARLEEHSDLPLRVIGNPSALVNARRSSAFWPRDTEPRPASCWYIPAAGESFVSCEPLALERDAFWALNSGPIDLREGSQAMAWLLATEGLSAPLPSGRESAGTVRLQLAACLPRKPALLKIDGGSVGSAPIELTVTVGSGAVKVRAASGMGTIEVPLEGHVGCVDEILITKAPEHADNTSRLQLQSLELKLQ